MNDARPAAFPANTEFRLGGAATDGAGLSHPQWLEKLQRDDVVLVRNHSGDMHFRAVITDATPCYLFTGKVKFHRRHGWQVQRQGQRVYRMKMRLVRTVEELQ